MPEIPEVTLMAISISNIMSGKNLSNITILGGRYLKSGLNNLTELNQHLPLNILSVNVKGKFCWIELEGNWFISLSFGMTGAIYYEPTDEVLKQYSSHIGKTITKEEYIKHLHIKFESSDGQCFYFGDPRRFGTITIDNNRIKLDKKLNKLGPDMLTGNPITDDQFLQIFRRPKFNSKNICVVLMGQEAISGVGNYIKAEVLYECHISPWAIVSDIDDQTLIKLHHTIRETAQLAFKIHESSFYTYTGIRNGKGSLQSILKVYGKLDDPYGNHVTNIPYNFSPDKRTTYYVQRVQHIGNNRDPYYEKYEN